MWIKVMKRKVKKLGFLLSLVYLRFFVMNKKSVFKKIWELFFYFKKKKEEKNVLKNFGFLVIMSKILDIFQLNIDVNC